MNLTGSCGCGAVTYSCSVPPRIAFNCHCRSCRKDTGSAYGSYFGVAHDTITIEGEVTWYERLGDSGKPVSRSFCPQCGSRLFTKLSVMPGLIGVSAGTLDDPDQFKPQFNIYTSRAPSWDFMDPALPKFPQRPPMAAKPE